MTMRCRASFAGISRSRNTRKSSGNPKQPGRAGSSCSRYDRAKWHIQRIDKSRRLVGESHLAAQLLAEGLHHTGAEAPPSWKADRGAAAFGPGKVQSMLLIVDRPGDIDAPAGH